MSGPLAKALMDAGWTPTAAVTARMAVGALAMAIFATIVRPGWVREAIAHRKIVIAYGVFPIAGAQLCYYNAVAHLSVGVALLLEYTAPVLVVGYLWATTRRRPTNLTLAGVALAIAGIMLVLDVFAGAHINATGVAWGLAAAVCAASYFMMSDEVSADGSEGSLNSITLAAGGLIFGAAATATLGIVRRDATDLHHQRHRRRGADDVLAGARHRARRDHHGDRLHAWASWASPGCGRGSHRWSGCPR